MKRRLVTKKILVAAAGVGAVSYVVACGDHMATSGNLMAVDAASFDAAQDVTDDTFATSGNLMGPPPDAGADVRVDAADASDAGGDAADDASDANDDG